MKKLSRYRLLEIYYSLKALATYVKSVKLSYVIAKNLEEMDFEIKTIEKIDAGSPEWQEFEQKRIALCTNFAAKDDNGKPVIDTTVNPPQYVVKDMVGLDCAVAALKEQMPDVIKERNEQLKELEGFLKEEIELNFYTVPAEIFESDNIFNKEVPSLALLLVPLIGYVVER